MNSNSLNTRSKAIFAFSCASPLFPYSSLLNYTDKESGAPTYAIFKFFVLPRLDSDVQNPVHKRSRVSRQDFWGYSLKHVCLGASSSETFILSRHRGFTTHHEEKSVIIRCWLCIKPIRAPWTRSNTINRIWQRDLVIPLIVFIDY